MVYKYILLLSVIFSLFFISCGHSSASKDLVLQLMTSHQWEGKQIELEGYIYTDMIDLRKAEKAKLKLHTMPVATKGNLITSNIYLNIGDTVNCLKVPKSKHYKPNDLTIIDNGMNNATLGSKVKIKGKVIYPFSIKDNTSFDYIIDDVILTIL